MSQALVPAAGYGTRMAEVAGDKPKELLPVSGRPAILRVLDEIWGAGVERCFVILRPGKEIIEYTIREARGLGRVSFIYVSHSDGSGLAHDLLAAEAHIDGPFVMAWPDNLIASSATAQLLADYCSGAALPTLGTILIRDAMHAHGFGNSGLISVDPVTMRVVSIPSKQRGTFADNVPCFPVRRAFGRFVLDSAFWSALRTASPCNLVDDEIPALRALMHRNELHACHLEGTGFDVGNPHGYAAACASGLFP